MENLADNFKKEELEFEDCNITYINPRFFNMEQAKELVNGKGEKKKNHKWEKLLKKLKWM